MLPSVVRQVGKICGNNRIYIEDYAYAYLSELKRKREQLPVKVALFGRAFAEENITYHIIYGAIADLDGHAETDKQIEAGREFFPEYKYLGNMRILDDELMPGEKEGCFVFCEENTAMQDYLIACMEKQQKRLPVYRRCKQSIWKYMMQKFVLFFIVILLAVSVSTIDRYHLMREFAVMAAKAFEEIR